MYILHYHYFDRDEHGNPARPHFYKYHGERLSDVMSKFHVDGLDHNLVLYTPRIIDDVTNTEEE